ncbi:MAG: hypothetical protein A3A28_05330 [Candidatus Sungbacteria bacterium RIFCSPLOWO2_01_FULL_47_32]|uniref:Uncharacterized protein n=1 Tax=Candidatus Sungbacteria bacterium RIFCSPHIGHO2_01_FULL_47_32 TaxID=1802264 RepID=A0A1G2K3A5_9BACT|nr:MAG: hypothetical protein UX72_C0001G0157 [Parcubacteria group bacterium GW2011_GWA2_47_10]OGZ93896.1 MAG: hypothetical protein A2633_05270 [Candidatus Sungbacteria bacterium RIFCSPHIGHO2_01_FULL_47_32]OGZ99148.1 MAG: hypothetical protein A3D57_05320 [Candidatus Sungbacteria bacterium RIFCSPHIGHO2_02_FULL_46_12]OHA06024.1 MAG: hypothetical protein A3A28_05330 [Candidatus Sungbacteria bacterium RIFCSPLOWO2_01_FULL_47_32]
MRKSQILVLIFFGWFFMWSNPSNYLHSGQHGTFATKEDCDKARQWYIDQWKQYRISPDQVSWCTWDGKDGELNKKELR